MIAKVDPGLYFNMYLNLINICCNKYTLYQTLDFKRESKCDLHLTCTFLLQSPVLSMNSHERESSHQTSFTYAIKPTTLHIECNLPNHWIGVNLFQPINVLRLILLKSNGAILKRLLKTKLLSHCITYDRHTQAFKSKKWYTFIAFRL